MGGEAVPTDRFEQEFEAFLERREYDAAEAALFAVVRAAFLAGWRAGRKEEKVIEIEAGRD